jgi:hypothetical protein
MAAGQSLNHKLRTVLASTLDNGGIVCSESEGCQPVREFFGVTGKPGE